MLVVADEAADDALRTFAADALVSVTGGGEANWLEDDALELARGRYGIPVTQIDAYAAHAAG